MNAHDIDVTEEDPGPIAAVTCPRCEKEMPRSGEFCMWCHRAVEYGAVDGLNRNRRSERRRFLGFAKENPELRDRLEETARRFVDETDG